MMGRRRPLTEINDQRKAVSSHAERAAINTPIQGGAADIVIHAMIKAHQDELLNKMGWHMVLQVHDELMLEGPEVWPPPTTYHLHNMHNNDTHNNQLHKQETAHEALARLKELMCNPLPEPLLIELLVDGDVGKNWFESK